MKTHSDVSDFQTCQNWCKEKQNCKVFYWKGESATCRIAEHLYEDESNIIEESQSIIGSQNCSSDELGWINSIFITRPQESPIGFIVGSVFAILLIASIVALLLIRRRRQLKPLQNVEKIIELTPTNLHQKVEMGNEIKNPGDRITYNIFEQVLVLTPVGVPCD